MKKLAEYFQAPEFEVIEDYGNGMTSFRFIPDLDLPWQEEQKITAYIQQILENCFESFDEYITPLQAAASVMGKRGGSSTSVAKKQSSRENGKLGGRPKKQ